MRLVRGARAKSPVEVIDQPIEDLSILFFDTHHPVKAADVFGVATRFRQGDRLPVLVDPVVTELSALHEHTHEVLGLLVVGRGARGSNVIDITRGLGLAFTDMGY